MNPSVPVSCSSEERGEQSSWVCDTVWDNPTHPAVSAMSVGLENARQFPRGGDWDWTATAVNNPLLLSHHHHHHQHQQQHRYQNHHQEQSDSEEQKPQITAVAPPMGSFRQYNGMGLGFASHHHAHHHQNALGLLNSAGIRSFGSAHDGIASPSSFHPGLLYTEMPAFGGVAGYDSRSQLLGMMSMQEQHHHKEGTIFHDIKREDVCAGDFQARIGLNLGHRTYFSAEDTAVSRLYKRPRAIPPASQVPRCQAEGCKADLSNAKHYHRRHKVCEFHSKATSVVTGGVQQRFCQQCSRFHVLSEFDEVKRSCRKRLADHNRRRRKPQPNAVVPAVSSNGETSTTAPKSEGDNNNKNGPGSNETRGLQVAPAMRTESQALLNAMSLPLMLQNGKGQMTPNPNANSTNSNPSTNPPVLQANSHKVSAVPCQQQQYTQTTGGHQGPSLSMGLCNQKQAAAAAAQDYSGLELALPWLRPSSEYSGSHHRPSPPMDILQPLMSEKADVEGFSSSIQNFLPLSASNSRELGTGSHWIVGNSGNTGGLESGQQQMFSLLENPTAAAVRADDSSGQQPPVEYLSHRRHQGGLNSKDTVEGHSDATKFSEMQSLRPFGQSIYDGSL